MINAPGAAQTLAAPSPVTPLNLRLRSRSTDRFGLGISDAGGAPLGGSAASQKFVDPLVVRAKKGGNGKVYECPVCAKCFGRSEHLKRCVSFPSSLGLWSETDGGV